MQNKDTQIIKKPRIPVFGQGISTILDLTTSACSLANAYGRKRRNVPNIKNKFNHSFIKSINQEQHLPTITNHTNDVVKNITCHRNI